MTTKTLSRAAAEWLDVAKAGEDIPPPSRDIAIELAAHGSIAPHPDGSQTSPREWLLVGSSAHLKRAAKAYAEEQRSRDENLSERAVQILTFVEENAQNGTWTSRVERGFPEWCGHFGISEAEARAVAIELAEGGYIAPHPAADQTHPNRWALLSLDPATELHEAAGAYAAEHRRRDRVGRVAKVALDLDRAVGKLSHAAGFLSSATPNHSDPHQQASVALAESTYAKALAEIVECVNELQEAAA